MLTQLLRPAAVGLLLLISALSTSTTSTTTSKVPPTTLSNTTQSLADKPWTTRPLTPAEQQRMTPSVWRKGCPVALEEIRRVTVQFVNYQGHLRTGQIDVHERYATDIAAVFQQLLASKFAINKIRPIEAYGGSDDASIDDDNTAAFNCRTVTGGKRFSEHAYGRALDLNPYRNPYVRNGKAQARPDFAKYVNRATAKAYPGVVMPDGPAVASFAAIGWQWGGTWNNPVDYQHFSSTGK